MQSHICRVHVCLAVTCYLTFFLHATAVTWGWNRDRNKSQHRKLTHRFFFSCHSCQDLNPRPFNHESGTLPLSYPCSPPPHPQLLAQASPQTPTATTATYFGEVWQLAPWVEPGWSHQEPQMVPGLSAAGVSWWLGAQGWASWCHSTAPCSRGCWGPSQVCIGQGWMTTRDTC